MSGYPLHIYHRLWSRMIKATRRGDVVAAEKWQRLAERELRIVKAADDRWTEWARRTGGRMDAHLDELQQTIAETERKLAAKQRRLASPD